MCLPLLLSVHPASFLSPGAGDPKEELIFFLEVPHEPFDLNTSNTMQDAPCRCLETALLMMKWSERHSALTGLGGKEKAALKCTLPSRVVLLQLWIALVVTGWWTVFLLL